jgi:hypothetical protein
VPLDPAVDPTTDQEGGRSAMSAQTRLKLGIALLLLGLVMPAGTVFVAATNWPGGLKALFLCDARVVFPPSTNP